MQVLVFAFLLNKSCDHIFDMGGKYLSFSLTKHQKNCSILEIQHFLNWS